MAALKRSFYQMLGVDSKADQRGIDAAYAAISVSVNVHAGGSQIASQAAAEKHLLREGYRILSDPALRAIYDAKLEAAQSGAQFITISANSEHHGFGLTAVIFAAITVVLGGLVYSHMTRKMAEIRTEHQQTVAKKQEDQNRPVAMNAPVSGDKGENSEQKKTAAPIR